MIARNTRFAFAQALKLQEYAIRPLAYEHKTQALKFVQEQFFKSQPTELAFYKQFPKQKSKSYLYWDRVNKLYGSEIFRSGLSFGCFDVDNGGEMSGVILSKDYAFSPLNDSYPEQGTFLYAVRRLKERMLSQVTPEYYSLVNEVDGEEARIIDMWFAAVHPMHRNKGLLRRMMMTLENYGARNSYQYIFSWATNVSTAACYKRLGYEKISEVDVSEFEDKGIRYFREIEDEQRYQSFWMKAISKSNNVDLQEM